MDNFTFDDAMRVGGVARSYLEHDFWQLKRNARCWLYLGNLNRAINQTRLALLTYRELRMTSCTQ
jgi:hypothetical protein